MPEPASTAPDGALKIGVLVPEGVYQSSLQKQIEAAAGIGAKGNGEIEIEYAHGAFDIPASTLAAYKKLRDDGADVIVGGMTATSAATLGATMTKFGTPTIILGHQVGKARSHVKANILKLGVPASVAYTKNLQYWIDKKGIKSLSVLYGGDNELTYKYGSEVTQKALEHLHFGKKLKFSDISLYGRLRPELYKKMISIPQTKGKVEMVPDGIVMSSPYHDKLEVLSTFAKAIAGVPVFIAPPVASTVEVGALAKRTKRSVYYSIQFWPTQEFADAMKKKLKLKSGEFVHPYAVAIHDAVKIAGTAWLAWKRNGDAGKVWTAAKIDRVKGAGGELKLLEGHIMAGPVGLLSGEPDGKVGFVRTPVRW